PELLKCLDGGKPFFTFWHTYNVHYPYGILLPKDYDDANTDYDIPPPVLGYLRHLIISGQDYIILDSYRRQIQSVSRFIKQIASRLKKLGKFEETYFIITADHGEAWRPDT